MVIRIAGVDIRLEPRAKKLKAGDKTLAPLSIVAENTTLVALDLQVSRVTTSDPSITALLTWGSCSLHLARRATKWGIASPSTRRVQIGAWTTCASDGTATLRADLMLNDLGGGGPLGSGRALADVTVEP